MKSIKFDSLTQEQRTAILVVFTSSETDEVKNIYMRLDNKDMFTACYDTLLSLGHYRISFFAMDFFGKYKFKVVS